MQRHHMRVHHCFPDCSALTCRTALRRPFPARGIAALLSCLAILASPCSIAQTDSVAQTDGVAQTDDVAQTDSAARSGRSFFGTFREDVSLGIGDGLAYATAPASFSAGDWLCAGALAAGTGALFAADQPVRDWIQRQSYSYTLHKTSYYGTFAGKAGFAAVADAALYATALLLDADSLRVTARLMGEAMVFGGAVTFLLQFTAGRERPFLHHGSMTFRPGQFDNIHQSLPSGHTMIAFACMTVVAERSENILWKIAAYTAASVAGLSLMYRDLHWASDVFAGAAIGTITGQYVCTRERGRDAAAHAEAKHLRIGPAPGGVSVSYRF